MPFTSVLGSADSVLGLSMLLGSASSGSPLDVDATSSLSLTDESIGFAGNVDGESVLALTDEATGAAGGLSNSEVSSLALGQVATATLSLTFAKSAANTLALTQTIAHNQHSASASDALALVQEVDQHGPLPRVASSLIILEQAAYVPQIFSVGSSNSLSLTQSPVASGPLSGLAASTLTLLNSADTTPDKFRDTDSPITLVSEATGYASRSARNTLSLSQASIGYTTQRLSNEIVLAQSLDVRKPIYVGAASELVSYEETFDPETLQFVETQTGLVQSANVAIRKNPSVHHFIQLTSAANGYADRVDGITADAENTITFTQVGRISNPQDASNTLAVLQSAIPYLSQYNPSTAIAIANTASVAVNRAEMAVASVLTISQAVRFVVQRPGAMAICEYSPFVGASSDPNAPEPPSTSLPPASEFTGFRLLYPAVGTPTDMVTLRHPNLGDINRLAFDRINRETRGGTLVVFADPIWPKIETLLMTFSVLKREEADELLRFMLATIGRKVRLIDWENRAWIGVIVNPQDPIVEDRRNSFTASFEFEGTRTLPGVQTASASATLNLSQAASTLKNNELFANTELSLSSIAGYEFLHPLRTGDAEILLTGDGEPLEAS